MGCCDPPRPAAEDARLPWNGDSSASPPIDVVGATPANEAAESATELNVSPKDCCGNVIAAPEPSSCGGCCGADSVQAGTEEPEKICRPQAQFTNSAINSDRNDTDGHSTVQNPLVTPAGDCCSALRQPSPTPREDTNPPECCRGKQFPCCDDSCLDRLALRECDETEDCCGAQDDQYGRSSTSRVECDSTRRACKRHRRSVREQYAVKLAALGCICRALTALGRETCCELRVRSSLEKRKSSRTLSSSRESTESCCGTGTAGVSLRTEAISETRNSSRRCGARDNFRTGTPAKSCCKPTEKKETNSCPKPGTSKYCPASCEKVIGPGDSGSDSCCVTERLSFAHRKSISSVSRDPEIHGSGVEHVTLSVSGLTCTGCETKLKRTLETVAGIGNLRTSLVLSRAEFDVDLSFTTAELVVKHLERTTEFKCEIITRNGSTLDVIVSEDTATFINRPWPEGVTEISSVDQHIVRVAFDSEVIGARDLIEGSWNGLARLAPVSGDQALVAGAKHVRHVGLMTVFSALLTIPVLVLAWAPVHVREIVSGSISLALATLVQGFIAGPFYPKAMKALVFSRVIEMDLLIVLSTSVAYVFSIVSFGYSVAGKPLSTGQFFETSTLLVTLIMVGRYVAALARQKAVESISIRSLQVHSAILVDSLDSPSSREVDARLLQYGDFLKITPDTRIPTDGTVVSGVSEVNESMLTGESRPVEKRIKSNIIAGTINGSGTLIARVTRLPGDNTITTIAGMVDEAKLTKPKMQELADKVSSYFVPVIVGLTIITFAVWIAVGMAVQGKAGSGAVVQAITYAITVLIVSCPCAIGLAVPMVVVIVSGMASKRGVIFKSASAIEVAHTTSHVILDKTGTLTQGELSVAIEHYTHHGKDKLPGLLGLIGDNKHPVSMAVASHLKRQGISASPVPDATNVTGCGVQAQLGGRVLKAGNARWVNLSTNRHVEPVLKQGHTTFCFTVDGELCAVFGLEDSIRDDAAHVVSSLRGRGISVHIVSGDDEGPVQNIATKLGIPVDNVRARSSPSGKQTYIKKLLNYDPGTTKPVVIFCGDGTNDAVALAQATIGIHINQGSDIAQSAADVVLIRPALSGILTVIDASEVSVRRIKFNFRWSFVYNTFAVLLAAGAFVTARIPPAFAGLGELVSVLPVIVAAVLLRWSDI